MLKLLLTAAALLILFYSISPFSSKNSNISLEQSAFNHWQKIDNNGKHVAQNKGPWRCVIDTKTGLVWENKQVNEGISHYSWTYNQGDGREHINGSCTQLANCTTRDLIEAANREQWCGQKNWRLPSIEELQSLLDHSKPSPETKICDCFLPKTQRSSYWSETQVNTDKGLLYQALNFQTGEVKALPSTATVYVRLVSSTKAK